MRNKILGAALGLAIVVGAVAWQTHAPRLREPRLLSETAGSLKTVALQYTLSSSAASAPCYRAFLDQLEPDTRVIVVCGEYDDVGSFAVEVKDRLRKPREIHTVIVGKPITTWCKDRFLVGTGSPAALICPAQSSVGLSTRTNDWLVAPELANSFPSRFRARQVDLRFDAGDVLPIGSRIIASDTLWNRNKRPPHFRDRLRAAFGMDVIWLRGVPDHHIGMYAAPLDDHTILVGDPEAGRRLWTPSAERSLGNADFSPDVVAPFERAARQLRAAGFRVIRVPLIVLGPQTYITYTNGVFETRGSRRIVYMPVYGNAKLDDAGMRAYESAGWKVRPVPVRTVYKYHGTIGCLINVLQRQ